MTHNSSMVVSDLFYVFILSISLRMKTRRADNDSGTGMAVTGCQITMKRAGMMKHSSKRGRTGEENREKMYEEDFCPYLLVVAATKCKL